MSRLEAGQNTNPTYATLARYAKAIGAELSLQVRVPNGSPEEESTTSPLSAESVASLHAALTMVLHQLESLKAHV
jgi:transcriptional regulator with XRE-family HTH domain